MSDSNGVNILIVDADHASRASLVRILTTAGYRCVPVVDADEAKRAVEASADINAILCDIQPPRQAGLDLLKYLTAGCYDVAVVITTAIDDPNVARSAFELGAFGYVVKPFGENELLINLANALRRHELELARAKHVRALETALSRLRDLNILLDDFTTTSGDAGGRDDTMERLGRAISLRDEETGQHLQRVAAYAAILAERAGYTDPLPADLGIAATLHDVGKIGIPDAILLKPGRLTADEMLAMRRHSKIGYGLLCRSDSPMLALAAGIALGHHEWWDGRGYPHGTVGEDIPAPARVVAVADVFDALTSHRIYRPAMPIEQATDLMREGRGTQFEPRLLDTFFDAMDDILAVREAYPDNRDEPARIRVLVVDDHQIFTESVVRLLQAVPDIKVVGRAATAAQARDLAIAYTPDVVLMDLELPDGDGIETTEYINNSLPGTNVVVLTARTDERSLIRAIKAGCCGFITKHDAADRLIEAIRAAVIGEMFVATEALRPLLAQLTPTHRGLAKLLSDREIEVLGIMARGLPNKHIARELQLSFHTVGHHVQNILYKLDAHSKLEAVATAAREGIIDLTVEPTA